MPAPDFPRRTSAELVIAIDGPSGSGKSTVSRLVAARLGLRFLDTGSMYRALTWWVLEQGIDLDDEDRVGQVARELRLEVGTDPDRPAIVANGIDVTQAVRETRISEAVSAVATNLVVRKELVRQQQELIAGGGIVAEGRDITTVVAPEAPIRVLLTASQGARLERRARDVHGRTDDSALAATRDQVLRRDSDDASVAQFHEAAPGVRVLDSSTLTLEESVDAVLALVSEHLASISSEALR